MINSFPFFQKTKKQGLKVIRLWAVQGIVRKEPGKAPRNCASLVFGPKLLCALAFFLIH